MYWEAGHFYIIQSEYRMGWLLAAMTVRGERSRGSRGAFKPYNAVQPQRPYSGGIALLRSGIRDVERHYSHQVMAAAEHVVAIRGRA